MAKVEYWFPTPIWTTKLNLNNKEIASFCKNLSKKNKGRKLSNKGGWQSHDIFVGNKKEHPLYDLNNCLIKELLQIFTEMGVKKNIVDKIQDIQYWININTKGDYNSSHNHPCSILSGVYYVQVPNEKNMENKGPLIFKNPNCSSTLFWYASHTEMNTFISTFSSTFIPEEGILIIFPSWLEHSVMKTDSDKKRISIAFNITTS